MVFSDPGLSMAKLEKKLSKVYGKASHTIYKEPYWDKEDVEIDVSRGSSGRLNLDIRSKVY